MDLSKIEVTQAELAAFLPLTDRQLRNLKKAIPPTGRRGTSLLYNLRDSTHAYLAYVVDARMRVSDEDFLEAKKRIIIAQARKEEALADSAEVSAKRDKDLVVAIETVKVEVETLFSRVKSRIRAIPNKIVSKLAGTVGQDRAVAIQATLEEELDEALEELSRPAEEHAEAVP